MGGWLKELFSEQSSVSSMRVMSMLALLIGAYIAIYGINHDKDPSSLAILVSVFVGAAFTGKVAQKAFETKDEDKKE